MVGMARHFCLISILCTMVLGGCTSPNKQGAATRPDLEPQKTGTSGDPTETDRAVTADARIQRVTQALEKLRQRKFKEKVAVELQSLDDFRSYVLKEIDTQLPQEEAINQSLALQALGLLPEGYDLREGMLDLFVSQAGAYYNPETRTFYILMTKMSDEQMDAIILHELQHALQDQYHDLKGLHDRVYQNPNEDVRAALSYLFEGEATYIMLMYQVAQTGHSLEELPPAAQNMIFRTMRNMDREKLVKASLEVASDQPSDIKKATQALADAPGILFWSLYDPYFKGQYAIHRTRAALGWAGVAALFENPPTSTEQMLHPEKLQSPRDEPTLMPLPALEASLGPGWKNLYSNSLGEAGVLAFLDAHRPHHKEEVASGWDGDRYALYGKGDAYLLCWWSVWDTEGDAEQMARTLDHIPAKKYHLIGDKGTRTVVRNGSHVALFVGDMDMVDAAMEAWRP